MFLFGIGFFPVSPQFAFCFIPGGVIVIALTPLVYKGQKTFYFRKENNMCPRCDRKSALNYGPEEKHEYKRYGKGAINETIEQREIYCQWCDFRITQKKRTWDRNSEPEINVEDWSPNRDDLYFDPKKFK